jgi:hypothetical protein
MLAANWWPEEGVVMTRILSDDGRELAEVALMPGGQETGGTATIAQIRHGSGSLLRYYFEQGCRTVELDFGESRLSGTLSTRWAGGKRQWGVRLEDNQSEEPAAIANQMRGLAEALTRATSRFNLEPGNA